MCDERVVIAAYFLLLKDSLLFRYLDLKLFLLYRYNA